MNAALKSLVKNFRKDEGFSYDLLNGELNPIDGYMVSIEGFELRLNLDDMSDEDLLKAFDYYLKQDEVSNTIFNASDGIFFGTWKDKNEIVLDLSLHFDHERTAMRFGKLNNQLAIYDCANKKSIEL